MLNNSYLEEEKYRKKHTYPKMFGLQRVRVKWDKWVLESGQRMRGVVLHGGSERGGAGLRSQGFEVGCGSFHAITSSLVLKKTQLVSP